jgi:hypothetical protein
MVVLLSVFPGRLPEMVVKLLLNSVKSQPWWPMPVIPATQEAEIRRMEV